jgi:hypothetical protein
MDDFTASGMHFKVMSAWEGKEWIGGLKYDRGWNTKALAAF